MLHIEMASPLLVHELFYILWWSCEQEVVYMTLVDLTCPACILTCQVILIVTIGVSELLSFVTVPCNVCWVLLPLCTCWQVQMCWACCFKTRTASALVDRYSCVEPVALRQKQQVHLLTGATVLSLLLWNENRCNCWTCCFETRTASALVDRCNCAEPVALRQEQPVHLLTGAAVLNLLLWDKNSQCTCWQMQLCWTCCFETKTASAISNKLTVDFECLHFHLLLYSWCLHHFGPEKNYINGVTVTSTNLYSIASYELTRA